MGQELKLSMTPCSEPGFDTGRGKNPSPHLRQTRVQRMLSMKKIPMPPMQPITRFIWLFLLQHATHLIFSTGLLGNQQPSALTGMGWAWHMPFTRDGGSSPLHCHTPNAPFTLCWSRPAPHLWQLLARHHYPSRSPPHTKRTHPHASRQAPGPIQPACGSGGMHIRLGLTEARDAMTT